LILLFTNLNLSSTGGATLGPKIAANLAITSADIGMPQLSMHSIRETGSTLSISQYIDLLNAFFQNYGKIRESFSNFM
jgi:aspartyl aminopeptidase